MINQDSFLSLSVFLVLVSHSIIYVAIFEGGKVMINQCQFMLDTDYFYRQQRSCGKVMFFTPVCHSVHWGMSSTHTPWQKPPRQTPPWADIPLGRRLLHQTVRILLECILVSI